MRKLSYSEQLKHPTWQRRRLEILQRADFRCESCEATEKTLHVHHRIYRKGAMAWEYDDHELVALCEDCHQTEHLARDALSAVLSIFTNIAEFQELLGYAQAIAFRYDDDQEIEILSAEHAIGVCNALSVDSHDFYCRLLEKRRWKIKEISS